MLKLFSKSKPVKVSEEFSLLRTDMHSHLLPAVDDGAQDMETSLHLIRGMVELGYKKLITTPHVMWDMYRNTYDGVMKKLDQLREAVNAEKIDVEIEAGAEYFLDDHVEELIKKNEPLLTISGKMVLVEFSLAHPPMSLKDILFEMQMTGYQPVIAHPERYIYLEHAKDFYEELKDIGCLFQLNLLSLANFYGKSAHDLANYLIRKDFYDLVGTDLHSERHLEALRIPAALQTLRKLIDSGKIKNSTL